MPCLEHVQTSSIIHLLKKIIRIEAQVRVKVLVKAAFLVQLILLFCLLTLFLFHLLLCQLTRFVDRSFHVSNRLVLWFIGVQWQVAVEPMLVSSIYYLCLFLILLFERYFAFLFGEEVIKDDFLRRVSPILTLFFGIPSNQLRVKSFLLLNDRGHWWKASFFQFLFDAQILDFLCFFEDGLKDMVNLVFVWFFGVSRADFGEQCRKVAVMVE